MYFGCETTTLSIFLYPTVFIKASHLIAGTVFCNSAIDIGLYDFRSSLASTRSNLGCDIAVSNARILLAFAAAVALESPKY